MRAETRQWLVAAAISLLIALVAALGFWAGRYSIIRSFETRLQGFARAFTLGPLLGKTEKKAISRVYKEGEGIIDRLDDISWSVPNAPAPFIGSGPAPGSYRGAEINALQFRAEGEVEMPKPDGTFRIFLTGGSTAYGSGAPDQERTIGGYLSALLSVELTPRTGLRYEVFTMANPAWASTQERIIIENRLTELQPDLVISFSGTNDVHWGMLGRNIFWFRTHSDEFFFNLLRRVYTLTGRELPQVVPPPTKEDVPPALVAQRLRRNVALSAFALAQVRSRYLFVLQPALDVTGKRLTERERRYRRHGEYFTEGYRHIRQTLAGLGAGNFSYLDLSTMFDQAGEEDIFLDSYHFGDRGNELVARELYQGIVPLLAP